MSHITKIKTKISDLEILKRSLKDLKMEFVDAANDSHIKLKSWGREEINEKILLEIKTGSSYNIGVVFNEKDHCYEFIADWWGIECFSGIKQDELTGKIFQRYAYDSIMDKVREKGYELVSEQTDNEQNIRVVLRKWQ